MKLRIGFVTNSSSSSFTIARSDLTDEQIEKIKNYFEAAKEVGTLIAKRAIEKNIKNVVYDRGGYIYHGIVKELAEAAREAGLEC